MPVPTFFRSGFAALPFLLFVSIALAQTEPSHPILSIPGTGSGASTILPTYSEAEYLNFVPQQSPRDPDNGYGGAVVPGDTGWSWSASTPNQITSTPSNTVFRNGTYLV